MSLLQSDVRQGHQRPTRCHLPADVVTSAGPDICELAATAGLFLDDWQRWFLEQAMGESVPGERWSAFEVACLVSRQNGKGALLEARQLGGLFYLREALQVHTAHEFKTAFEHFLRITSLIEGCPDLDRKVQRIRRGAGEQAVELKTGERLRFLARSTGSGRGFSGDAVYLDEAFALTAPMMGALLPTLSAVQNPQVWYTSSAPRETSEVLHGLRRRGLDDGNPRLFFAEWSVEDVLDIENVDNWYAANPAMGIRISEEFVRSELDALRSTPVEFARERLGVPDPIGAEVTVVPLEVWQSLVDEAKNVIVSHRCFALDASPDMRFACFAAAGRRKDGKVQVEAFDHRPRTGWVVERAVELYEKWRVPIRVERGGPAGAFLGPLREAGVEVVEVSTVEHTQSVGQFLDLTGNDGLRHPGGSLVATALASAVLRASGDASRWGRRSSKTDITALVAVTLALGGVPTEGSYSTLDSVL
jgi:hypothetical protein